MTHPIGLFRAHITSTERLVNTTVGRTEMLADLLEKLGRNAGKKGGQHFLFVGPRGIGKTHFLSLVENAVATRPDLKDLYTVVRFPEENNRILCFADILLQVVRSLGESETDGPWPTLYDELSTVQEDRQILDAVIPRLRRYRQESGRTVLMLMENLDALFGQQIKSQQDIHRFRTFLMDSPCATLVGTSPVFFSDISDVRKPFFEFFDVQVIEDLSEALTLDLVKNNLQQDRRQDLLDRFDELEPKIRALHTMTGGNPRLIMMLYELIAFDNILEVKTQFEKLLDKITPFYQDRMKELAPQERALLEIMALMRIEPRTPAAIAVRMRKPPQQISSLLKRMIQSGYLTVSENPKDKRSRLYRIKEGFFDLWLAMSESRAERKRLGYLVKMFEVWYQDRMERDKKRCDLRQALQDGASAPEVRENQFTYLDYLSDVGDSDERCGAKLELSVDLLKAGQALKAKDLLKELKPLAPQQGIFTWMTEKARQWTEGSTDLDISQWFESLIDYWKVQRSGDLEKAMEIAQQLGLDLSERGLHEIRIELLSDALNCDPGQQDRIELMLQLGASQRIMGRLVSALDNFSAALKLCQEIGDKAGEGTTLNYISQIYDARGDYDTALDYLNRSLAISQEIGDKSGEGTTLNNISRIYHARGKYDTALDYLTRSLAIRREIGAKAGLCVTLFNIGNIHLQKEELLQAFHAWITAYRLAKAMNLAEGLTALEKLAKQLDLPGGMAAWETLANQMEKDKADSH